MGLRHGLSRWFGVLLVGACYGPLLPAQTVRAWKDTVSLPAYREGEPDANLPFDAFRPDGPALIYPYTARENYGTERVTETFRRLHLENEYLACQVLPDLGGRLSGCLDKLSGRQMFFSNTAIKPQSIAPRGAWIAMGIELNFPVTHSRTTISPVQSALMHAADGSAAVVLSAIDERTGMQWQVEYWLHPAAALLEQKVTLYNRSDCRHSFEWWNNAAVRLDDPDMRFIYPMHAATVHGSGKVESWPVNSWGVDLSTVRNHRAAVGLFALGSHEPFFGVYLPKSHTAVMHYAAPEEVPGKKLWTWGDQGNDYVRKSLTDDDSTYVELQAGVFRDQDTFGFLEPLEARHFTEYWIPGRDLDGVSRANPAGVLYLGRVTEQGGSALRIELNATRAVADGTLRVQSGGATLWETKCSLTPRQTAVYTVPNPPADAVTLEWRDSAGRLLMRHLEGHIDAETLEEARASYQPEKYNPKHESEADYLAGGRYNELHDLPDLARGEYQRGLLQFPHSAALWQAAGQLDIALGRYEMGFEELGDARRAGAAGAEIAYYAGLAQARLGKEAEARQEWAAALSDARFGAAATLQTGLSLARTGDAAGALAMLARLPAGEARAGGIRAALERRQKAAAGESLRAALRAHAADPLLRVEAAASLDADKDVWADLARDPQAALDIAAEYLDAGLYADVVDLLAHEFPTAPVEQREPGAAAPQGNPLVLYYRAYARHRLGQDATADLKAAAALPLQYIAPHRAQDLPVLRYAVTAAPSDASAHFLLGCLYLQARLPDVSVTEWQTALSLNDDLPGIYRDLGRALLLANHPTEALDMLRKGAARDRQNADIQAALRSAASAIEGIKQKPEAHSTANAPSESVGDAAEAANFARTPEQAANYALALAAGQNVRSALAVFTSERFPKEKQSPEVRRAYFEVQLQNVITAAAERRCDDVERLVWNLGDEDKALPFTMYGFGAYLKLPRTQYYLGLAESACDDKEARKHWSKIAKGGSGDALEHAFTMMAAAKLDPGRAASGIQTTLEGLRVKVAAASGAQKGELLYAQGVLLRAAGQEAEAIRSFRAGAETAGGFAHYLNVSAMTEPVIAPQTGTLSERDAPAPQRPSK